MKKNLIYAVAALSLIIVSCSDDDDKKTPTPDPDPDVEELTAHFSGTDVFGEGMVSITRDKTTKATTLNVDVSGEWKLYAGSTVDAIDFETPIVSGSSTGEYEVKVSDSSRSYFQFISTDGDAILSERHLPMTGGYNFRDLGGFKTKEGKFVKWGKVFRSDDLSAALTDGDREYLSSIPLKTIVDFRWDDEKEADPDVAPASVEYVYELPLDPGNLASMSVMEILSSSVERLDSIMKEVNRELVTKSESIEKYTEFFKLLQSEQYTPLMFHCSAGKDRTGMGAYLFLSSLGVDEETIIEDYLFSNECLQDKYESKYGKEAFEKYPQLNVLTGVKREYLQTAIDEINENYGSVENYLTNALGVDLDKMKSLYLYSTTD